MLIQLIECLLSSVPFPFPASSSSAHRYFRERTGNVFVAPTHPLLCNMIVDEFIFFSASAVVRVASPRVPSLVPLNQLGRRSLAKL
jgi:hypothetical protein